MEAAIPLWREVANARAGLVNYSENHTFRLDPPVGPPFMLRVHRPDYQSVANIESELAWLEALRRDTGLPIPEPVAGIDGRLLQQFRTPTGEHRYAVLFRFLPGAEPTLQSDLGDLFQALGAYAARMHEHVIGWQRPPGFERQAWNAATILDPDGLWGNWRIAPGVTLEVHGVLDRATDLLRWRLADYGAGEDRYGLIHADMRLGNILVDGPRISLIDFDDSGFCWFAYDFAASVSFHETHPAVPALKAAWIKGYTKVRPLAAEHVAMIDSMVLLRRMALLAWIGSHSETSLAQSHRDGFAMGTADLATRYLGCTMYP